MLAGEIAIRKGKGCEVDWTLKNFMSLNEYYYHSPVFTFADESWNLDIFLNGNNGYIHLALYRTSFGSHISVAFSFALKNLDGQKYFERHDTKCFNGGDVHYIHRFVTRSKILRRQSEFLSSGSLKVVCTMNILQVTGSTECSYCGETVDIENNSFYKKKCMEQARKCPEFSKSVLLKNSNEHGCQSVRAESNFCWETFDSDMISSHKEKCRVKCSECLNMARYQNWHDQKRQIPKIEASQKLSDDLEAMLMRGDLSDTVVKVKGEEFLLHRSILAARNSFFYSMFTCDMKEKNTGIVTIDDCEPDVFRSFIHFLYTGKVNNLSIENMCALYEMSDKYQEEALKAECLQIIMNLISVDSFIDSISIALKYNERDLLGKATKYFASNTKEIICGLKWLIFLKEYPVYANELFIKALDLHQCTPVV